MNSSQTFPFTKTKTLCTLGPASDSTQKIIELIHAGMDGIRLNFSHGSHDYFKMVYDNIYNAAVETSTPIAVLVDLQGPKIRVGELETPTVPLIQGETIEITADNIKGNKKIFPASYEYIVTDASVGDKIYIDDGYIKLEVIGKTDTTLKCVILQGGNVKPHKGMNLPGMKLTTPALTDKDIENLEFALNYRADYVALSFVRSAKDIQDLRGYLKSKKLDKFIIAKIEKQEGVDNLDSIIEAADGIMVARGDLGVELPPQLVPNIQKEIIHKCNLAGKLVITATQMLESMVNNAVPTRAEASDVANAVWDGTDVVMLSEETSIGKYPVEAVKVMDNILRETEAHIGSFKTFPDLNLSAKVGLFDSAAKAVSEMAVQINASAIVVLTNHGRLPALLSKYRPQTPIIALSDNFEIMNVLRLVWGIMPLYFDSLNLIQQEAGKDEMKAIEPAIKFLKEQNALSDEQSVIFTSGAPVKNKNATVWIKILTV